MGVVAAFTTGEHFEAKKLLKTLVFNLKFEHTGSFTNNGEIFGILFLPENFFSID